MTSNTDIDLGSLDNDIARTNATDRVTALHPIDGGPAAWKLLWAAFVFEALLWGFPLSFGVFQDYYARLPQFEGNGYISVVGTTASGISYLGAPLMVPIIARFYNYRQRMVFIGWPICVLGLVVGSFADHLGTLILTQGVMYGIGFLIFYYPILSMVDEYWIARRGMAYGLLCSASGLSGAVMPLILQALLSRFGYRTTLRSIAIALVVLTGPLIPLLRSRTKSQTVRTRLKVDWTFVRRPLFWIYSLSNVMMGLGYFFPALYLPSYATAIGLSSTQGALLLTLMSISQVLGQFLFGYLSDKIAKLDILIITSLAVAATAIFGVWGNADSFGLLIFFAILYGFFGAGYTAMWARMVTAISREPSASQMMFTLLCFGKGIGNILAGPISARLLATNETKDIGYGHGQYKLVVIFTGACMLFSMISSVGAFFSHRPSRTQEQ